MVAEIPSPAKGRIHKLNYALEQACLVGKTLCEIEVEDNEENQNKVSPKESEGKPSQDFGIDDILNASSDKRGDILDFKNHKSIRNLKKF